MAILRPVHLLIPKYSKIYLAEKAIFKAGPSIGSVGIISSIAFPISFDEDEIYNQYDAEGFINLFGLPTKVQAQVNQKTGKLK